MPRLSALCLALLCCAAGQGHAALLAHFTRLNSPTPPLSAGADFLNDSAARNWFRTNRPQLYPSLMSSALTLRDQEQMLAPNDHPQGPAALRYALISYSINVKPAEFSRPEALMAIVNREPTLSGHRDFYEKTVLKWDTLPAELRESIVRLGFDQSKWSELSLLDREGTLQVAYKSYKSEAITAPLGTPEHTRQRESALEVAAPFLTREDLMKERHEARLGPSINLTDAERNKLSKSFQRALRKELLATRLGKKALHWLRANPVPIDIIAIEDHAIAHYHPFPEPRISFSEGYMAEVATALGYEPRALLTDKNVLHETACIFALSLVREATHHRQNVWGLSSRPPDSGSYGRHSEQQAFMAQLVFHNEKMRSDPDYAATISKLKSAHPFWGNTTLLSNEAQKPWFIGVVFTQLRTLEGLGASYLEKNHSWPVRSLLRDIEIELKRRRHLTSSERAKLESESSPDLTNVRRSTFGLVSTNALRQLRRKFLTEASEVVKEWEFFYEHSLAEIEKLRRQLDGI